MNALISIKLQKDTFSITPNLVQFITSMAESQSAFQHLSMECFFDQGTHMFCHLNVVHMLHMRMYWFMRSVGHYCNVQPLI